MEEKFEKMTAMELAEYCEKDVETYKTELEKLTKEEDLTKEEEKVIEELNKLDEEIKTRVYILPEKCEFEGQQFTKNAVAPQVIYFLNKTEVTWQYTLGMYQLVKFWKGFDKEITYGALDSTLRMLDQCKFKGFDEWKNILMINEYFKPLHEAYAKDTTRQIWLSKRHNAILERIELIAPRGASEKANEE